MKTFQKSRRALRAIEKSAKDAPGIIDYNERLFLKIFREADPEQKEKILAKARMLYDAQQRAGIQNSVLVSDA